MPKPSQVGPNQSAIPTGSCVLVVRIVDDVLVAGEGPVPEGVELVAQRGQSCFVELVDPPCPLGVLGDQAGVFQNLEML